MDKGDTIKNRSDLYKRAIHALQDTVTIDSEAESEFNTRKIIKYGTKSQAARGIFKEYCDNTTIHGIRYMGEIKRPLLERFFWIFFFCLSIFICFHLTKNVWDKWNNDPVIMSFAEESTPIWRIPFPSVTICPITKSNRQIFNFTDNFYKVIEGNLDNMTEKDHYYMDAITQLCFENARPVMEFYGKKFADGTDLISALEEASVLLTDTFEYCSYPNYDNECELMFHKVITAEGVCFSFNTLDPNDIYRDEAFVDNITIGINNNAKLEWNLDDGYSEKAGPETFPYRVLGAGQRGGLFVGIKGKEADNDYLCQGPKQGFKIILHTPGDVPQVSQRFLHTPFMQEVTISIKPKIITTLRNCYSQKERYLKYFKLYTQKNCELECLSNFTMIECGCVKFSMPRTAEMPVCGANSIACINQAEDNLLLQQFQLGMKRSAETDIFVDSDCKCLPSCTSIVYETETSQSEYDYVGHLKAVKYLEYMDENPGTQMSLVSIFFKEAQFLASKRSELYGTTDFLANCGGLLGLFMGVSTLSIVELIYFCTVRLCINLKMRRQKRQEMLQHEENFDAKFNLAEGQI